ncbi:MAG: hypothetical protein IKY94_15870 [Lachnospiraceae bacterium]|jgi:hypothetical protein|nr:hypothetical protein [Lachnospiraceae bacterium]
MKIMIIFLMGLMVLFILSCLNLTSKEEEQYCPFYKEICEFPQIFNCRNCPKFKERVDVNE